ncbi:MAG: tRNA (adenosine(37)-N6)-threonylcarbamoyltransferase complex ATPase subunit type 1 TsaE [Angelakisella sp.]
MIIKTNSPEETIAAGEALAKLLRGGDILAYTGGMGAGKTTFTIGLAKGLELDAWVSSPTFALVHEYEGRLPERQLSLCHFDMFRINTADDLYSTGFFDYLESGKIIAVEWSENIAGALPKPYITVAFEKGEGDARTITITGDERF